MLFIKKQIGTFEISDSSAFKEKIDAINKCVLPAKMLVKKKKKDKGEKDKEKKEEN